MAHSGSEKKVAILLCTYNGAQFLGRQLESFLKQTHENIELWISDDGSTDDTRQIIEDFKKSWGDRVLQLLDGPGQGYARNFMEITCNKNIKADFYAYSDQDDIWLDDKLQRAIASLEKATGPALYGSSSRLIDGDDKCIGSSRIFKRKPCFKNALVQTIAGGNTMVLNHKAMDVLRKTAGLTFAFHDWWAYLLISGVGGEVMYDAEPTICYRQHTANIMGSNTGLFSKVNRLRAFFGGEYRQWNQMNVDALSQLESLLTEENLHVFRHFKKSRDAWLLARLSHLLSSGVYRQNLSGNISLIIGALLHKI